MDYHEHMKHYYDRLASEYEQNEAFREEPSEDLPGLLTRSFRRLALRDLPKVLHGRNVRRGTRWPDPVRGKMDGDGHGRWVIPFPIQRSAWKVYSPKFAPGFGKSHHALRSQLGSTY